MPSEILHRVIPQKTFVNVTAVKIISEDGVLRPYTGMNNVGQDLLGDADITLTAYAVTASIKLQQVEKCW
jgi:hypothetical protein